MKRTTLNLHFPRITNLLKVIHKCTQDIGLILENAIGDAIRISFIFTRTLKMNSTKQKFSCFSTKIVKALIL